MAAQPREKGGEPEAKTSPFLPSWSPEQFNLGLGPIIGVRTRSAGRGDTEYDSISSEIGLGARIRGIPLVPSNPGITVEPYGSYTWGNRTEKLKSASLDQSETSGFQRYWYGFLSRFYFNYLRYSLDIGTGNLNFDDKEFTDLKGQRYMNDFAILLVPYLSAHYTLTFFNLMESDKSKPTIEERDQWFHLRMAFSLFDFWLDLGPGFTTTKYSESSDGGLSLERAEIDQSYLKALTAFNIIWKLGASGSIKYVYDADKIQDIRGDIDQLPNETLSENKNLTSLPEGSLEASAFFGIRGLMAGFGVGWQLYYLELDRDGPEKEISRDQGLVVTYDGGF